MWVKSHSKPEAVTLLTICLQMTQVRKPLDFLRICGLYVSNGTNVNTIERLPHKRVQTPHFEICN